MFKHKGRELRIKVRTTGPDVLVGCRWYLVCTGQ